MMQPVLEGDSRASVERGQLEHIEGQLRQLDFSVDYHAAIRVERAGIFDVEDGTPGPSPRPMCLADEKCRITASAAFRQQVRGMVLYATKIFPESSTRTRFVGTADAENICRWWIENRGGSSERSGGARKYFFWPTPEGSARTVSLAKDINACVAQRRPRHALAQNLRYADRRSLPAGRRRLYPNRWRTETPRDA